uniref:Uncharacterized protein n=1 Tax=Romanomermis culicivorax TaxID=13658 RepID=A0A915IWN7_ROMCU
MLNVDGIARFANEGLGQAIHPDGLPDMSCVQKPPLPFIEECDRGQDRERGEEKLFGKSANLGEQFSINN